MLPPNDTCSAAILLPSPADTGQWMAGWTIGATLDNAPACSSLTQVAPGVWYKILGNGTRMTVTTCDPYTDFDTRLSVYHNTCDTLQCVAANDNFNIPVCGMTSLVNWCANTGETYYILVHGAFWYEVGHFKIGYWHDETLCNIAPDSLVIQALGDTSGVANRVRLYWTPVPYASAYCVHRDTTLGIPLSPATLIGTTADTNYTDSLHAGLKYFYTVTTSIP